MGREDVVMIVAEILSRPLSEHPKSQIVDLIVELQSALEPFVKMHRAGTDGAELACARGVDSDATYIFNSDFERAAQVRQLKRERQHDGTRRT